MQRCIVNVAFGPGHVRGQERLRRSLDTVGYDGEFLTWTDELPPGSPTHKEAPFGFKLSAIDVALAHGADLVLWVDASVWFVRDPAPIFDKISEDGCYVTKVHGAHWLSRWCRTEVLRWFSIEDIFAAYIPLVYGGFFGVMPGTALGSAVLRKMRDAMHAGCFAGSLSEHRHDQSCLSATVHRLKIKPDTQPPMFIMDAHEPRTERTVAVCRGMA